MPVETEKVPIETAKVPVETVKVPVETVNETVNATVNDLIVEIVRSNPGIRRPRILELFPTIKRGTLTRRLSDLSSIIEFRGAPKTGGYYCKE